uniref:Glycosyl hydrolase family 13 catalytic domain-containing protein n=1 Tax=Ciona savignyi TaxID=51511 RepID=H2Y6E5_CIOSA
MGSPEKPIDVEMGDMSDETKELNPEVKVELLNKEEKEEERFTGLKKEELLAISNEPKWVRARWVLFILFWLVWIGMLVGAILIVVNAPRCIPEPVPQWYQDTVVYEADVSEFAADFNGMKEHLPYIESLNAETVLISGASNPSAGSNGDLMALKDAMEKKSMKLMVDVPIDTMQTSHSYFTSSATASCTGNLCDFFIWAANGSLAPVDSTFQWVYNADRGENYKASSSNPNLAFINYGNAKASEYAMELVRDWFAKDVNGVMLRDLANVQDAATLVSNIWNQYVKNATQLMNATVPRALFLYSSVDGSSMFSGVEGNNSVAEMGPVQVTSAPAMQVNLTNSGKLIEDSITAWRSKSRRISAYTASPLGGPLLMTRNNVTSAGLNLLTLVLPGVPMLRSGDEIGAFSPTFEWPKETTDDVAVPMNADANMLKTTKDATVLRVAGIQALQALRYDTRDANTQFVFLNTGNEGVVAFKRQWTTKKPVLVASNMSPVPQTVSLNVNGGLLDKNGELASMAKVLVASGGEFKAGVEQKLTSVVLPSGTTVLLQ